jgi:hypothetical protein
MSATQSVFAIEHGAGNIALRSFSGPDEVINIKAVMPSFGTTHVTVSRG